MKIATKKKLLSLLGNGVYGLVLLSLLGLVIYDLAIGKPGQIPVITMIAALFVVGVGIFEEYRREKQKKARHLSRV